MAALLGAHIIKVKPPSSNIELEAAKNSYKDIDVSTLSKRIHHVMQSSFNKRRRSVFSGNAYTI